MKLGTVELLVILFVIVLLVGPTQIPKLTKMFGEGIKSFRKGISEEEPPENKGINNADQKERK